MAYSERRNLIQKLERARKENDVAILTAKAAAHALVNLQATIDDLLDELIKAEEQSETSRFS